MTNAKGRDVPETERSGSVRLPLSPRNVPRIGSKRSMSLAACQKAVRAPFEERLGAFLDFLYSDARATGITGRKHAKVLFRRWLELSITHDREEAGGELVSYFAALARFYPEPAELRPRHHQEELRRSDAEQAMRGPFEDLLSRYLRQVYSPERSPGIRDEAHARETFITFCGILQTLSGCGGH